MPWELAELSPPIPNEVKSVVTSVSEIVSGIRPIFAALQSVLNLAQSLVAGTVDPYHSLAGNTVTELERIVNDLYGTGAYNLFIQPWDYQGRFDTDDFGGPQLTPNQAIQLAYDSFDDLGDLKRPQFSDSATVTAFGVMVTAPTLDGFTDLLDKLKNVFNFPGLDRTLEKANENKVIAVETYVSQKPDWESKNFGSVAQLANIRRDLLKMLHTVRGFLTTADDVLTDMTSMMAGKINLLQSVVASLESTLASLEAAIAATGVYFLNIPPQVGGNKLLKQQLSLNQFYNIRSAYTAICIWVGGGPSLTVVDTIRTLIV